MAILLDGSGEGILFRRVMGLVLCPDADEDLSADLDGGRDRVGQRVAVGGSVEADGGEISGKALEGLERRLPVGGGLARAVGVVGADVEALPVGVCAGGEGEEGGGDVEAHCLEGVSSSCWC